MIPITLFVMLFTGQEVGAAQDLGALIEGLGSDRVEERDEAQAKLLEMGEAARPALKKASLSNEREISERARTLLQRLELRKKFTSTLLDAMPGIDLRILSAEDSAWTEAFLQATEQRHTWRRYPTL